jgi:hypothetical protein
VLLGGINHVLVSQENKGANDLLPQLWFQARMMLAQKIDQFIWELRRQVWVALGNMCDEVDVLAQGHQAVVVGRRIVEKYREQSLILLELALEIGPI